MKDEIRMDFRIGSGDNRQGRGGLSLVEVLVTLVIISALIIPLFNLLAAGRRGTVNVRKEVQATLYADELLEQVLAISFKHLPPDLTLAGELNGTFATIHHHPYSTPVRLTPLKKGFSRQLKIGRWNDYLKHVRITVKWACGTGEDSREREVFFDGLVAP